MNMHCLMVLATFLTGVAWSAPVELGTVDWGRDLEQGLAEARAAAQPVLILFQEVPGCGTCRAYGADILSHPLIEEAIENLFVPVVIFNNREGSDQEALEQFREPSWNNPVVRIVDADRRALSQRVSGDYTRLGLVNAMIEALQKSKTHVPAYLSLLRTELAAAPSTTDCAVFAMACFWSGESRLGALDGVVETRPGFLHGEEVVEVRYDPAVLPYHALVQAAQGQQCTRRVFTRTAEQQRVARRLVGGDAHPSVEAIRPDDQPKYYLASTSFRYVPMTPLQATRVNGALGTRIDPESFLSPRQRTILRLVERHPRAGWIEVQGKTDLLTAWQSVGRTASRLPIR